MKTIIIFLLMLLVSLDTLAQTPTYDAVLKNGVQTSATTYEFDVYIMRTGGTAFEMAGFQIGLSFNAAIKNGGNLTAQIVAGTSEFAFGSQPNSVNIDNANNRYRISTKVPGAGNGQIVPVAPGLRYARFRITNTATFGAAAPNLTWIYAGYPTAVSAYIASINTAITTPPTHTSELDNNPLPVQLASFTGNIENKRDVKLTWKTSTETNNRGFEIERKPTEGTWSKVGYINGKGTTTTPVDYAFEDKKLNTGKYNYRLKQIDNNGNYEYHNLSTVIEVGVPTKYDMSQNYPNPFNPTTKIDFDLPLDSRVSIILYDISGREVMTLVNDQRTAGYYTIQFNSAGLSSGTYFYRIMTKSSGADFIMTKKMMLVK